MQTRICWERGIQRPWRWCSLVALLHLSKSGLIVANEDIAFECVMVDYIECVERKNRRAGRLSKPDIECSGFWATHSVIRPRRNVHKSEKPPLALGLPWWS
ncbi:hypothetical protein BKA70DRAFT_1336482 [Coprinopsis sp. MPI-PUGE-AT-0042]|nr:hypothetical protein BKA70DRAFT_1336482 [Coprinopsis sp. MPI-PUGE-AT-0042]